MSSNENSILALKQCTKCDKIKTLNEFHMSNGKPKARCKVCRSVERKERHIKNKDKENEQNKIYRLANIEQERQRSIDWNKKHKERKKINDKRYTDSHRPGIRARARKRRKDNLNTER